MSQLKLHLLGTPRIELNDQPITLPRRKVTAILIYLAMTGQPHRRDTLASLFWPESGQKSARGALRRELHALRSTVGDGYLATVQDLVSLSQDANIWIDTEAFQHLVALQRKGEDNSNGQPNRLQAAETLYRGDFLAGFTLEDCPEFDDWQFFHADVLRREFAGVLEKLVYQCAEEGELETAINYARKWLALDPMHEPAHRVLMDLYALAGQQAAAIRQYDECARILDEELGIPPAAETEQLLAAIRTRQISASNSATSNAKRPVASKQSVAVSDQSPLHPFTPSPVHNLPPQSTTFVGRENELNAIRQLLAEQADCRLLTLVGPGGIGKTRLSIAVAQGLIEQFPDGVYFVGLAPLSSADYIVPTIAEVLSYTFQPDMAPEVQLNNYLSAKKMLLVVDNLEHLLDGAELLSQFVAGTEALKLLVTSREALAVQEEWLYPVGGMVIPDGEWALRDVAENGAVQLFVQRAVRAEVSFTLTAENVAAVVQICQLVDGMPLGLELAAGWVDILSVAEIAAEIQEDLDFMATRLRNVPQRQRSMRAVFDASWQRLPANEQISLSQLSVFRGGFTRAAAQIVAGAKLPTLRRLMDKSFLHIEENGRYQIHELLRQYSAEKLDASDATRATAAAAHSAHYLNRLHQLTPDLYGGRQRAALDEIEQEIENIRVAWRWVATTQNQAAINGALDSLYTFFDVRGGRQEAVKFFELARQYLAPICDIESSPTLARLLSRLCFMRLLTDGADATMESTWRQCLKRAEAADDQPEIALNLLMLGSYAFVAHNDPETSLAQMTQSLAIYRRLDKRYHCVRVLEAISYFRLTDLATAQQYGLEALAMARTIDDTIGAVQVLISLSEKAMALGDYEQAEDYCREACALAAQMDIPNLYSYAMMLLGSILLLNGEFEACRQIFGAAAEDAKILNYGTTLAFMSIVNSAIHTFNGDHESAIKLGQAGLNNPLNNKQGVTLSHWALALAYIDCQAPHLTSNATVWQHVTAVLNDATAYGSSALLACMLPFIAVLLDRQGETERAVEHLALAYTHPQSAKGWMKKWPLLTELQHRWREELGEDCYQAVWERGTQMDLATMAALARAGAIQTAQTAQAAQG